MTDPVREISVEEANDLYSAAAIADENGEEIPDIPWECDNILTVLDPGTYYFKMTYSNEGPWYYYYEMRYREVEYSQDEKY